nr:hypothetical protein [Tanacetum cinerariifolium]
MFCRLDTAYRVVPIRRIENVSALTVVKIDLTWSLRLDTAYRVVPIRRIENVSALTVVKIDLTWSL